MSQAERRRQQARRGPAGGSRSGGVGCVAKAQRVASGQEWLIAQFEARCTHHTTAAGVFNLTAVKERQYRQLSSHQPRRCKSSSCTGSGWARAAPLAAKTRSPWPSPLSADEELVEWVPQQVLWASRWSGRSVSWLRGRLRSRASQGSRQASSCGRQEARAGSRSPEVEILELQNCW